MVLAWKVEEREGRGFCLVANKSLVPGWSMVMVDDGDCGGCHDADHHSLTDDHSGELVLAEKPLFTVPAEEHNSDLDQYLENALEVIMIRMLMLMQLMLLKMINSFQDQIIEP